MASLNKVMLIGNLGKDPEVKYTTSGQAVATFSLATTRKWKNKEGALQEDTQWHNLKVWARQAEVAQQYLKKGSRIYAEGRLEHRSYDDKDGNRKWFTEVVVDQFIMLDGRRDSGGGGSYQQDDRQPQPQPHGEPSTPMGGDEDDLPF